MKVPEELLYTKDHEWVKMENGRATVGITDFAQAQLGDVVFIDIPAAGSEVAAGDSLAAVESVKAVSDVYAPLAGVLEQVNEKLTDAPELVNQDPYGEGWIVVLAAAAVDTGDLLTAAEYRQLLAEED